MNRPPATPLFLPPLQTEGGVLNTAVYGQFEPSHHILVRRMTIQNLFGRDESDLRL